MACDLVTASFGLYMGICFTCCTADCYAPMAMSCVMHCLNLRLYSRVKATFRFMTNLYFS
uniref:Uncharacterized protein n=1 Tax=Setaria viridis TaxID=4556 RepID=A0A4U6T271_SETVI|nr:hypothetical protein SEVIR_9G057050v2 [Setaria viridis]